MSDRGSAEKSESQNGEQNHISLLPVAHRHQSQARLPLRVTRRPTIEALLQREINLHKYLYTVGAHSLTIIEVKFFGLEVSIVGAGFCNVKIWRLEWLVLQLSFTHHHRSQARLPPRVMRHPLNEALLGQETNF